MGQRWTQEAKTVLAAWWSKGVPTDRLAKYFGTSAAAVRQAAAREGVHRPKGPIPSPAEVPPPSSAARHSSGQHPGVAAFARHVATVALSAEHLGIAVEARGRRATVLRDAVDLALRMARSGGRGA